MNTKIDFRREVMKIAIPVALQSLLQSSFSVVDQIMTGQLGEAAIAGIGLAGKFSSIYSVLISAIAAVAGIMISQYIGKKDEKEVGRSYYLNLALSFGVTAIFCALCVLLPKQVMGLYTQDSATRDHAAEYLQIIAIGFPAMMANILLGTLLRCRDRSMIPMYATLFYAALDTALNYLLIFGKLGFPELGVAGAAWATTIAEYVGFAAMLIGYLVTARQRGERLYWGLGLSKNGWAQYVKILAPILVCEFFWSLGENVYAAIYGHIGTDDCAAMTLISPMVVLFMGTMSGISQAAGILTGKRLGANDFGAAYSDSKKLLRYALWGSLCLSALMIGLGWLYVKIFRVSADVQALGYQLLIIFAIYAPAKVLNMTLGGGILRSGGKTQYSMITDLIGTWGFGVPLGLLTAFVLGWPITAVYAALTFEECIRLAMVLYIFRSKKWMEQIQGQ